jgi:hypothetical protein
MTAPRYARLASQLFVREREMPDAAPTADARAQAIAAVAAALSARRRARRTARWAAAATAAAAIVAATGAAHWVTHRTAKVAVGGETAHGIQIVAQSVGGGASVVVSGAEGPLAEGRTIPEGSRLVTPADGRATLAFSTGTSVTLGEGTELTVGGEGSKQLLHLGAGWVDLHVAKLGPNARFIVDTSDAEVEVRGTRFRVSIAHPDAACGRGTPTRVAVTEGVVVVRQGGVEARVGAGEEWPPGCAKPASAPANASSGGAATGSAGGGTVVGSALSEENRLYAKALGAKNHGDARGAVAAFDRFLSKYPASPNAEDAMVERMRLLRSIAPTRAVSAAHQYLGAYPTGNARDEAEGIVAGGP